MAVDLEGGPIRWLRGDSTQRDFAATLAVTAGRIGQIENGWRIGPDLVLRIWAQYGDRLRGKGISLVDLLSWGEAGGRDSDDSHSDGAAA